MAIYKLLNGKKVKLSKAEEKARKEQIEQAKIKRDKKIELQEQKKLDKDSAITKLVDLGLTENEIDALIN